MGGGASSRGRGGLGGQREKYCFSSLYFERCTPQNMVAPRAAFKSFKWLKCDHQTIVIDYTSIIIIHTSMVLCHVPHNPIQEEEFHREARGSPTLKRVGLARVRTSHVVTRYASRSRSRLLLLLLVQASGKVEGYE